MKRTALKKRKNPMRPNPEHVRAWLAKSRAERPLGQGPRERPPRQGFRRHEPVSTVVLAAVITRDGSGCLLCPAAAQHPHHVLPRRRWPQHNQEPRNVILLCAGCHAAHEHPGVNDTRIQWMTLPLEVRLWLMAQAVDDGEAAAFIERAYQYNPGPGTGRDE
jgi:hypothetical protein